MELDARRLELDISIHALREEGDERYKNDAFNKDLFLSTPSAGRATLKKLSTVEDAKNFYPRPPQGGRLLALVLFYRQTDISIHALRKEGDQHWQEAF